MNFRSLIENENADLVMPAWIAGIQVRKDASGDIRVNLDSSTPCWNDQSRGLYLNRPKSLQRRIFKGVREGHEGSKKSMIVKFVFFVISLATLLSISATSHAA